MLSKQPNFLIIMIDEMRYPPFYETEELVKWQTENLTSLAFLRKNCMEFNRHYAGATACVPSRATIFTGQYPSLHGVKQTTGMAKETHDPDVFWLDPNTVPVMGEYFEQAGYQTYYKGKWHISDADIIVPGTNTAVPTYNQMTGVPNKQYTSIYENSNRLNGYGFNGWVGPEPHGTDPNNSGNSAPTSVGGRDVVYADDIVRLLEDLQEQCTKPWLVVASFINPHDITLFGDVTDHLPTYDFQIDDTLPNIPPPPTINDDLSTKPDAQKSYKQTYPHALQPITNGEKYRKFYYSLQKYVDKNIQRVLKTISESPMYDNTIIIFTSDHGDQLGSHGLFQKWHNVYEESLHVPLIFHNPILFKGHNSIEELTSHVDLLPTMLNLANIDMQLIQDKLKKSHTEVQPLVGKIIPFNSKLCKPINNLMSDALYFWTIDNPTKGLDQTNKITGKPYSSVVQPNAIEAIIVYLPSKNKIRHLYKYAKYFDPNNVEKPQYEMYNVTLDPLELENLVHPSNLTLEIEKTRAILETILIQQRHAKKLTPKHMLQ